VNTGLAARPRQYEEILVYTSEHSDQKYNQLSVLQNITCL